MQIQCKCNANTMQIQCKGCRSTVIDESKQVLPFPASWHNTVCLPKILAALSHGITPSIYASTTCTNGQDTIHHGTIKFHFMVLEKTCLADCDFRKWSRHSPKVTSKTFFCRPSLMAITLSIVVSGKRAEFFAVRTLSWSVCWELNKNPDVCFSADFSTQTMARGRFWPGFDDLRAFSWGRT